jgi:pyruvate/2-oxoglutarate dehydrogenase complex dihydrolipoamide acyltransferase (E2) component
MDDRTVYTAPAGSYLMATQGPGQGRMFLLLDGLNTIGRAPDNTIVLDPGDLKASRHHAVIRFEAGLASVEDLSSRNGTLLDGRPVTKAALPPGAELRVGETVFVLSRTGPASGPGQGPVVKAAPKPRRRRVLYAGVLILILGAGLLAVFHGGSRPPEPGRTEEQPATQAPTVQPSQAQEPQGQPLAGQAPRPLGEQSAEAARLGQFFYNSGKLKKAVEQWREALKLDPANAQASKLLARAEGELDQLVDKHYRQALLALRYQRTEEARSELRQVVENSPDSGNERTQDSLKKLEELGGR